MRLLPREEEFFDLFAEVASRSHEAAGHLLELFTGGPERIAYCSEAIKRLEHEADQVTHEVVNRLDRTFITPIDREDIHLLASDLDDVIDRIDAIARRAYVLKLGAPPVGVKELCEIIQRITAEVLEGVNICVRTRTSCITALKPSGSRKKEMQFSWNRWAGCSTKKPIPSGSSSGRRYSTL